MHCSSCSTAVEKALNGTDGVKEATVSLSLNMAEVTYDPTLSQRSDHQPNHSVPDALMLQLEMLLT